MAARWRRRSRSMRALALALPHNNRLDLCEALLVRGQIVARLGNETEAMDSFQRALTLAQAVPYPYAEGRILFKDGMALRRTGPAGARLRLDACDPGHLPSLDGALVQRAGGAGAQDATRRRRVTMRPQATLQR